MRALLVFWWVTILGGWVTILRLVVDGVWKGVYPQVFWHSKQLLLNKFFDPSTPSMRLAERQMLLPIMVIFPNII